jgi:tetratricopeptide (TPR) repeat protein
MIFVARQHRLCIAIVGSGLLFATSVPAQQYDQAQEIVASANQLFAAGNYDEARALLVDRANECTNDEGAEDCLLLMYYSLGYLEQRLSDKDANLSDMHLDRAHGYYQEVLDHRPDHGPTLNNLALVMAGLGDSAAAVRLYEAAVSADPGRAARYLLLIADLQIESGDLVAAISNYEKAALEDASWLTPLRRIVDAYEQLPAARSPELMDYAINWEKHAPDVAVAAYAMIVGKSGSDWQEYRERAVLLWVALTASHSRLTASTLSNVSSDTEFLPIKELRDLAEQAEYIPVWWAANDQKKQVFSIASLALGRNELRRSNTIKAATIWKSGLREAPGVNRYLYGELDGKRIIRLDIMSDLAALAVAQPDIDIGFDLEALVKGLFRGKEDVYQAKNLEAIQRYHTVLGKIYSDRDVWTSTLFYANGIFQLSNAIETAATRFDRTGFYQPQADLKERLARGYLKIEKSPLARSTFIAAAQAYLDTDEFDRSTNMVNEANRLDPVGAEQARLEQLQKILNARLSLADRESPIVLNSGVRVDARNHARRMPAIEGTSWQTTSFSLDKAPYLYRVGDNVLDDDFLARQRFKIIADESSDLRPAGASDAINIAVDNKIALVGAADLNRLAKVQRLVLTSLGPNEVKTPLEFVNSEMTSDSAGLAVALPGQTRASIAVIDSDTVLAAKIGAMAPFQWADDRPDIRVSDGTVFIDADRDTELAGFREQLKSLDKVAIIIGNDNSNQT